MSRFNPLLILLISLFVSSFSQAAKRVDSSKHFALDTKGLRQGIFVQRLSDGKVLFAHSEDLLLNPASVSKLFTSVVVLELFGTQKRFITKIAYQGKRQGPKINGDLFVIGDGDPGLISEKLWQAAADLRHQGIKEITGDLILDDSLFDDEHRDEQRSNGAKSSSHAYDAAITGIGINFNNYCVVVAAGDAVGKPARVSLDPYELKNVQIENQVKTSKQETNISVYRKGQGEGEIIVVSGAIGVGSGIKKFYRSMQDPLKGSGSILQAFLLHEGIQVRGRIQKGRARPDAQELVRIESDTLAKLIHGLNHYSNNYTADVLTKRLGAEFPIAGAKLSSGAGNFANGSAALTKFLRERVGLTGDFHLENGSGLSIENRVSARQVVQLLSYAASRPRFYPEFVASLPIAAESGSLEKRFLATELSPLKGLLRAKTGTLSEPIVVSALAGYLEHPQHRTIAFCIIQNGLIGKEQQPIARLQSIQESGLLSLLKGDDA